MSYGPEICAPLQITLNLSGRCNLNCIYCYAQPFSNKFIEFNKVIEILEELRSLGVFVYKIAGGEPLLHKDIFSILDYIIDSNLRTAILTNLAVDQKIVKTLGRKLHGAKALTIQVSLDSVDKKINDLLRGKSDIVYKNIQYLIDLGIDVQLASVVTKHNIDKIGDIIGHYYPYIQKFHFMNLMPTKKLPQGGGYEDNAPSRSKLDDFWGNLENSDYMQEKKIVVTTDINRENNVSQVLKYEGCAAGITFCDIDTNLDVLACNIARSDVLGNLHNRTFSDVWNSPAAKDIRNKKSPLCLDNKVECKNQNG